MNEEKQLRHTDRLMICRELAERAFEEICEDSSNRGAASIRLSYAQQALNEAIGHARALGRLEDIFALEDRITRIQEVFRKKYPQCF
jgi:hypothetical protein